ncbi:MAG: hypothetical protein HY360_15300 [Verrucomicrobia bacterium]|nr:hypothetical protein [Verrucomicrobiota bacterium]
MTMNLIQVGLTPGEANGMRFDFESERRPMLAPLFGKVACLPCSAQAGRHLPERDVHPHQADISLTRWHASLVLSQIRFGAGATENPLQNALNRRIDGEAFAP